MTNFNQAPCCFKQVTTKQTMDFYEANSVAVRIIADWMDPPKKFRLEVPLGFMVKALRNAIEDRFSHHEISPKTNFVMFMETDKGKGKITPSSTT